MITIDDHGDLIVKVVEFDDSIIVPWDGQPIILRVQDFLVKKHILFKHSKVLGRELAWHLNSDNAHETFTIKDDSTVSMEIWFRAMHATLGADCYDVPLDEIRCLTAAADKYELDGKMLTDWFERWYNSNILTVRVDLRNEKFSQLLYPCWQFDYAGGFLHATKAAIYRSEGHITEGKPTKHYECHLPSRIIQQLNAAKGSLRTKLHIKIDAPNEGNDKRYKTGLPIGLFNATCNCKEKTHYQYEKALRNTGVWPLERTWTKAKVNDILDKLGMFSYQVSGDACRQFCQRDYERIVLRAISDIRSHFDGLCLDCMQKSKAKTGDYDLDYWLHNDFHKQDWDRACRAKHGQPTWYFSFMGRKEDRENFAKSNESRR